MKHPPNDSYPAWRYGPGGATCIVKDADADAALDEAWSWHPDLVGEAPPEMPDRIAVVAFTPEVAPTPPAKRKPGRPRKEPADAVRE